MKYIKKFINKIVECDSKFLWYFVMPCLLIGVIMALILVIYATIFVANIPNTPIKHRWEELECTYQMTMNG